MGYFSNGTEGSFYEGRHCAGCVHNDEEKGCPVMNIHLFFNYDQCGSGKHEDALKTILGFLIPRSKDGLSNLECTMRVEGSP